jgi:hypothetical protein
MTVSAGDIIQSTVGKVADRLANKFLPSSVSDEDKLKLRLEAEMLALKEYKRAIADAKDYHEITCEDSSAAPRWTRALTATHRPMWSLLTLGIFTGTIFAPYVGYPQVFLSDIHKEIIQTVVIFYFAGRSIEKVAAVVWGK